MTSTAMMRKVVVRGPQKLELAEAPRPEPGPGEVRVRIQACGVCGTDLHFFRDDLMAPGSTPGHEMTGIVDALGEGVDSVREGAQIAVEPIRSCGHCPFCQSGRDNLCSAFEVHGVHRQGGFADFVVVPARRLFPIAAGISAPVAALAEPIAVSIHGLRRGAFEKHQRILVLGAGTVGLVTLLAAKGLGAKEVWISARYPRQAELARTLGAKRVLSEEEAGAEALASLARSTDFDLVVETVGGRADTLRAAVAALRPGGTVSVLGLFLDRLQLEPFPLLLKEANLCWSNCYQQGGDNGADFQTAVRLMDGERERLAQLATHQLPLEQIDQAFRVASDKRAGAVKVSVMP
ncbi:MAG: alcohol dehydrogenase catalytic domain-containing protein [Myxococcota bacterium]